MVHYSFKVMGGAERVALDTIEALQEMGFEVTLVTVHRPDLNAIAKTYQMNLEIGKIRFLFPPQVDTGRWPIHLQALPGLLTMLQSATLKADLLINTHAEFPVPHFTLTLPYSTLNNAPLVSYVNQPPEHALSIEKCPPKYERSFLWRFYFVSYCKLFGHLYRRLERYGVKKTLVLTNSDITKRSITSKFPEVEPIVVRPPVDVELFASVLDSTSRQERVLVVCRISPDKKVENAIELARLLPTGFRITIAGTYSASVPTARYLEELRELITSYGLDERVEIRINSSLCDLLSLMAGSKVYFHTRPGEPFGIAVVEAMAAGLIPIVPDYGGQTKFVPKQYQYHTLAEAAEMIGSYIDAPQSERCKVSDSAKQFSGEIFKDRMKTIIKHCLSKRARIAEIPHKLGS